MAREGPKIRQSWAAALRLLLESPNTGAGKVPPKSGARKDIH